MTDSRPTVAIVIPVFNEEHVLPELFARLEALFRAHLDCGWRVVFVNDGSRDRTVDLVRAQGCPATSGSRARSRRASRTPGPRTPSSRWTQTCRIRPR